MRSMGRVRPDLGRTLSALLTTSLAAALLTDPTAAGASSAAETDYSITIDPDRAGPEIDDAMYGAFHEDINRTADGGQYAELIQNRSFEYDTADHASYTPLTSWTETTTGGATGTARVVNDEARLGERNRNYLRRDNAQDAAARTRIDLGQGVKVRRTARLTTLQGDPDAVNTATDQPIKPSSSTLGGVDTTFNHTFPANSITFLRIATRK
ncbi:hypothetical protein ACFRNT_07330 [Streptomyces sp. NPDC056697]|uniref:hypothetical protein n=1 Tax=Streptomyces sp. NPDC056697 TaxID=3345915 RepID=UPI0036889F44